MRVLDVGAGSGRVTIPAAERVGPEGRVVALDLQPEMLRRLEQRLAERGIDNVDTVLGGAGEGRVGTAGFDRAFLVTVLGEILDPRTALEEIHGLLEPGGLLSVTEVFPDPHYQSRRSVRRLAEAVGFRHQETFGGRLAFTLNFRKG
jgi:ubiquinone/menaquinone biosynthesis C-methylase UbiE